MAAYPYASTRPLAANALIFIDRNGEKYEEVTEDALTYRVYGDHAEVTFCDREVKGNIEISAYINGVPVTGIGGNSIGEAPFYNCIMKLLKYIAEQKAQKKMKTNVKNKEINDIKSGKVSTKELLEHCRKNGEKFGSSENGISKEDLAIYVSKAKKCGMPISFRTEKGKDNIYIGKKIVTGTERIL